MNPEFDDCAFEIVEHENGRLGDRYDFSSLAQLDKSSRRQGNAGSSCREQLPDHGCGPRRSDESVTGPFDDVKGITNVAGAWMRKSDHLSHRVGPSGRAQGVRLKRLLLAPCRHCRPVNPMITLIQQAKYPASPK